MVAVVIQWVDEPPQVLGQLTPLSEMRISEAVSVDQPKETSRKFSTEEKLLILGLFLNIVSISWQAYQWRQEKKA